ncbi:MAG: type II toxin-antitoxin system PrlF family antitoxin [Gemmataceae bacterium]
MRMHYDIGTLVEHAITMTTQDAESTLTDRYQTTVPAPVRHFLGLRKRDRLRYTFAGDVVTISRCDPAEENEVDPALQPFLRMLAHDITRHPERVRPVDAGLVERVRDLTRDTEVDLDAPLTADDA